MKIRRAALAAMLTVPTASHALADASFQSRFQGAYVALTGGYDGSGDASSISPYAKLAGAKIGGLAGYNVTSGSLLVGAEARAQYSFAKSQQETSYSFNGIGIPMTVQSLTCFGCAASFLDNYPIPAPSPLNLVSANRTVVEQTRPWQVDLSFRLGATFDDWLVYGKFGGGIEQSTTVVTSDSSASRYCTPTYERQRPAFNTVQIVATGCSAVTAGDVTRTVTTTYNPIALVGAGVERNFGNVFARAEGELVVHLYPNATYYSPAAHLAVGYRF